MREPGNEVGCDSNLDGKYTALIQMNDLNFWPWSEGKIKDTRSLV